MPRLLAVELTADLASLTVARVGTVEVRFSTTEALLTAVDTAVLLITERSGSEFALRLERGRVTDVHLWDVGRLLRQGLPLQNVTTSEGIIRCTIPAEVLPHVSFPVRLSAALIVNGSLVQRGFSVTITSPSGATSTRSAMKDHV